MLTFHKFSGQFVFLKLNPGNSVGQFFLFTWLQNIIDWLFQKLFGGLRRQYETIHLKTACSTNINRTQTNIPARRRRYNPACWSKFIEAASPCSCPSVEWSLHLVRRKNRSMRSSMNPLSWYSSIFWVSSACRSFTLTQFIHASPLFSIRMHL